MSTKRVFTLLFVIASGCAFLPHYCPAPITFRPDEGVHYTAPGATEVPNAKSAQAQFDLAFAEEKKGDIGAAISGYKKTVRRFSKTPSAAIAQFKVGQLYEKQKSLMTAFHAYEKLVKDYPHSPDFDKALEGEFRIGTAYLEGARKKLFGLPTLPSMSSAVTVFSSIIKNAPFCRYAPLAAFNIGMAKEKQGELKGAISAYQIVVDKYPLDPAAADALYQIGFVWLTISRNGTYDRTASVQARENFEDFLTAYPNNEKAAQAREDLASLNVTQTNGALKIAQYYDKQDKYRAAVIYYNEVLKQSPESSDGAAAKKRLGAMRKKYGDATIDGIINPGGDTRLQSQSDTAVRPDYNGPHVGTEGTAGVGNSNGNQTPPLDPLNLPPPIPDTDQPSLPSPDTTSAAAPLPEAIPPTSTSEDMNSPTENSGEPDNEENK